MARALSIKATEFGRSSQGWSYQQMLTVGLWLGEPVAKRCSTMDYTMDYTIGDLTPDTRLPFTHSVSRSLV